MVNALCNKFVFFEKIKNKLKFYDSARRENVKLIHVFERKIR